MSKAAKWTIGFLVIACIGLGIGYAYKNGITFKEIIEMVYKAPSQNDDLQPNLEPGIKLPSTEPSTPDQAQLDQPGQPGQPEQPKTDMNPPFLGLPGLGIPVPPSAPSQPSTTEPSQGTEQQLSGTLDDAGAALDQLKLQSPSEVLKACVAKLKSYDLVGAERYVSPNGLSYTLGATTGVHEVLWKGLYQVQAYQTIGYDAIKVSGQTALVPLYASLGDKRMVAAYVVMAHRGDGWKLDHITDPTRF